MFGGGLFYLPGKHENFRGEFRGKFQGQISEKISETSFQISRLFSETSFSRRAVLRKPWGSPNGALKCGLKATLRSLCRLVCNCAHLWAFGPFCKRNFQRKIRTTVGNCGQVLRTSTLSSEECQKPQPPPLLLKKYRNTYPTCIAIRLQFVVSVNPSFF